MQQIDEDNPLHQRSYRPRSTELTLVPTLRRDAKAISLTLVANGGYEHRRGAGLMVR
jgi:hypothetical protein